MSIREIARTVAVNRKTVAKYVNQEDFSPVVSKRRKKCPVLGPFMPIIDQWLEGDRQERKKQRHTAKRIYDRLVAEHGYHGSERNVRLYVSKKKRELYNEKEGYIPLEHQPGEAQVDFGEMDYRDGGGVTRKGYFLNVSFPYSNAGFVQVFKGQNQECLLEGLQNIFKYIGGVPWLMVFDNLSAAVVKIKPDGERVLTENFERFVNHHGFEYRFCNPASGNEKGSVESKVGYHRRNLFVPVPTIIDFDKYNHEIIRKSRIKMAELHYEKRAPIKELFLEDRRWLLALPSVPFDNFRLQRACADKFGRVKIEGRRYSVTPSYARQNLWVKLYHDRIQILDDRYETIIEHPRLYGGETEAMNWLPYLNALARKPGALLNTTFYSSLPDPWQRYLKQTDNRTRKSAILLLTNMIKENKLDTGTEALEMAGLYGRTDPDSVSQLYYHLTHRTETWMPFVSPLASYRYNPSLTVYNGLLKVGERNE